MARADLLLGSLLLATSVVSACACSPTSTPPAASSRPAAPPSGSDAGVAIIDRALEAEWSAAAKTPSAPADDATWLRRASVDLLGRIPTEEEAKAFVADASADKRALVVDRMLASPAHSQRLARWWEDILLGPEVRERRVDRGALRRWLEQRFAAGDGWDAIVRGLVTAAGRSSAGGRPRDRIGAPDAERAKEERDLEVNGAVNWIVRWAKSPPDVAAMAARSFLGVQVQCAQCHDHKTESWKQSDFFGFAASFARVRLEPDGDRGVFAVTDGQGINRKLLRSEAFAPMALATPRALDGAVLAAGDEGTPRDHLAAWITSRDNPWTSRAFVNRVWARSFGMGFVDPVDDFRPSSTPVLPALLGEFAEGFEASGWDIRALERSITLSRAYGLAAAPLQGDVQDARWSTFAVRSFDEDALVDSFFAAIDFDRRVAVMDPEKAAQVRAAVRRAVGISFDADAESNPTRFDGTIQQALLLMSSEAVAAGTALAPRSVLAERLEREGGDASRVAEALFWRTFSRGPTEGERTLFRDLLAQAGADAEADAATEDTASADGSGPPSGARGRKARVPRLPAARSRADEPHERALEDLFWTLLNASEFAFVR